MGERLRVVRRFEIAVDALDFESAGAQAIMRA